MHRQLTRLGPEDTPADAQEVTDVDPAEQVICRLAHAVLPDVDLNPPCPVLDVGVAGEELACLMGDGEGAGGGGEAVATDGLQLVQALPGEGTRLFHSSSG